MKKILMFSLLLAVTSHVFAVPTITKSVSAGTTFKFTETLSEKLPTGYKVKIDLNNGKGLVAMTCSGTTCTLSSNALPKVDTSIYKVGIYDSKGVLQGATTDGSYVIVSTAEINTIPTTTIPIPTTGYTKISNLGAILPDTAKLGSGSNDWACTIDNKTGLTWEVKTTDGGLRDYKNDYSWYEPDAKNNGGTSGYQNQGTCKGSQCDTYAFTKAVNAKGLCGKKDWRMPTVGELLKLVVCSDGQYNANGACTNYASVTRPTINSTYFPDITNAAENYWFWSSSPFADDSSGSAWLVNFYSGFSYGNYESNSNSVRLVR